MGTAKYLAIQEITMKIGILSDTHDHHANVLAAIKVFNHQKVEYVLHAGDMVSPFTAKSFSKLELAKLIAVLGNNEGEMFLLKSVFDEMGAELHERVYRGNLGGREIFMTHVGSVIDEVVQSERYDLVIYGHSHQQDIRQEGRTLVINPGETTDWITGNAQIVIVELDDMSYEVVKL